MNSVTRTIADLERSEAAIDALRARRMDGHGEGAAMPCPPAPDGPEMRSRILGASTQGEKYPSLNPQALHGIAGEIVRTIEPHTEADSVAVLIQVLTAFGVLVGGAPYYRVEADRHRARLFIVLVGETAKGRKGTSWGRVRDIFQRIRQSWPREITGLVSGEGFKWQVRDPITRIERDKDTGEKGEVVADEGVSDKRLLVMEPEFAQILRVIGRQGNTLSADLRSAWDTGNLGSVSKHNPATATDAHVCVIAHVTADELKTELTQTDAANGLANRFLFACVKRSKCLPFGGDDLPEELLNEFARRLARAAEKARTRDRIGMTESARSLWERVYPTLSEGKPGLFGAVIGRAEAQTVRMALHYALLAEADAIDLDHLLAALALWGYCEDSARYIFGDTIGDPVADEILRALKVREKLTRTDIRDLLGKNQSADRIGTALALLKQKRLAWCEVISGGGGRPVEVWRAAT